MTVLDALIKLDQVVFQVITLGVAKKGETISAAAWNAELTGKLAGKIFRPIIDFIFSGVQNDHCMKAWQWQVALYKLD